MSAIKSYLKQEFKLSMLSLEHPKPTDFYLGVWQTTRSVVPLLIWRTLLFLTSVTILLSSAITSVSMLDGHLGYWFIYLTHWGITVNTLATGFATFVSARCYFYGPISASFSLPWYLKTYWVLFNTATPVAFMISIFYWTLLYEAGFEEELNMALDVAVHGLNSLVMFLMLISSSQPTRVLHVYQPVLFGVGWMFFGLIYHFAGGTDQKGNPWIYPVVNWADPGTTTLVIFVTGLLLVFLHLLTMAIAAGRDALAKKLIKKTVTVYVDEGLPLRNRQTDV